MIKNIDGKQIAMKQKKSPKHFNFAMCCCVFHSIFICILVFLRLPNAKRTTLSIM